MLWRFSAMLCYYIFFNRVLAGDGSIFKNFFSGLFRPFQVPRGSTSLILHIMVLVVLTGTSVSARAELRVVVSIPPLHSLAVSVLEGVAKPELLIKGAQSPHDFTLRPSDLQKLGRADLILRIGPSFETGLSGAISRLEGKVPVLSLMQLDGVKRLKFRGSALRSEAGRGVPKGEHGEHGEHSDHGPSPHRADHTDPHLWLDIDNAIGFVRTIARMVIKIDVGVADRVNGNATRLITKLRALDERLKKRLAPYGEKHFLTYHDAYQYFEHRYGLGWVGAVASGAHTQPGLRHLTEVREILKSARAVCLFTEPQFPPKLGARLISGTSARLGVLDPLGAGIKPGVEQYFVLMTRLGQNLTDCLDGKSL